MVSKTFASEYDVKSGIVDRAAVMQNYYKKDPNQIIPALREKLSKTDQQDELDTLDYDIKFLDALTETHKEKESEKRQDIDEINIITTESFLKNASIENNNGFKTPPQSPKEQRSLFNAFRWFRNSNGKINTTLSDEELNAEDFASPLPEVTGTWSLFSSIRDKLYAVPFFNRKKEVKPKEIDSIIVFIICASLAMFFKSSPTLLRLFRELKGKQNSAFITEYYGYIEAMIEDDGNVIIKKTIDFIQKRSIFNLTRFTSGSKELSSLVVYSVMLVLKTAVVPTVYLLLREVFAKART